MSQKNFLLLTAVALAFALAGCSHSGDDGDREVVEMVTGNQFEPSNITIPAGTTVLWRNTDSVQHTTTANKVLVDEGQQWDSGLLGGGETFEHTFDEPGTYPYFCIPHASVDEETGECNGMCATIVVEAAE